jgi:hypothetical protein
MAVAVACPDSAHYAVLNDGQLSCTTSTSDLTSQWVDASLLILSEADFYELSSWTILIVLTAFGIKMLLKLFNEDARR